MDIIGNIAYVTASAEQMHITAVKTLDDMMMILTFESGEKRLYDASVLLKYPAFAPLADETVFRNTVIDHGVVTWLDGDIDIAPETMYHESFPYSDIAVS